MQVNAYNFEYNSSINVISKKQFDVHKTLYNGYISKINEITSDLSSDPDAKDANSTYSKYRGLKESETFSLDGVILHELYFQNIGASSDRGIGPKTLKMLETHFSGYDRWVKDFTACATSARGWCILVYEQRSKTLRNLLQDTHNEGIVMNSYPLLVLDMYEHAYYIDYASKKTDYIEAFIKNINWEVIEHRIEQLGQNFTKSL